MKVAELVERLARTDPDSHVQITCFFCSGEVEPEVQIDSDRVVFMCSECAANSAETD